MKKIDHIAEIKNIPGCYITSYLYAPILILLSVISTPSAIAEPGITNNKIVIGGVMDLQDRSKALGQGMRTGILAAIQGEKVKGKNIEYITLNDSYNPEKTIAATKELIDKEIFLMLGNVGTPTAKVSLPLLADKNIPAVGFFTGAGLLRPGNGDIINYRASYVQETAHVINDALGEGVNVNEICAYVQNDAYGMAGVTGIRRALSRKSGAKKITEVLDKIISMEGENPARNGIGPVGVYQRNTFSARNGYLSLKKWEKQTNTSCRLVITVGSYNSIAGFIGYATMKKEDWVYSAVSFTGATNLKNTLATYGVQDKVIVTQVVPPLNSNIPIIQQARKALGSEFNYVSLEGYLTGKMMLSIMKSVPGDNLTRKAFVTAALDNEFDIGGLKFDFTTDNQASDLVVPTYLKDGDYQIVRKQDLKRIFE